MLQILANMPLPRVRSAKVPLGNDAVVQREDQAAIADRRPRTALSKR
jgi:hypothetical protein